MYLRQDTTTLREDEQDSEYQWTQQDSEKYKDEAIDARNVLISKFYACFRDGLWALCKHRDETHYIRLSNVVRQSLSREYEDKSMQDTVSNHIPH